MKVTRDLQLAWWTDRQKTDGCDAWSAAKASGSQCDRFSTYEYSLWLVLHTDIDADPFGNCILGKVHQICTNIQISLICETKWYHPRLNSFLETKRLKVSYFSFHLLKPLPLYGGLNCSPAATISPQTVGIYLSIGWLTKRCHLLFDRANIWNWLWIFQHEILARTKLTERETNYVKPKFVYPCSS